MYKKINKIKKGSKIIIILMLFLALSGLISLKVDAKSSDFVIDDFNSTLMSYEGNDKIVKIPKSVKIIGFCAFENNEDMEKLILPEGLIEIDSDAFAGCLKLKEIVFPSTLKTINDGAFRECYNLKTIIIKEGTERILDSAFSYCSITELKLPSTLKYFDAFAIVGCENLKQINIPKNCIVYNWEYIDEENSLECINVDSKNKKYKSIDGVVFSKDGKTMIFYPPNKKVESYTIPDSVRYLEEAKFYKTIYLKHLTFGKNVTWENPSDISYGAIFMNGILEDITVPAANKTFCDVNGVLFTKDKKTLIMYPEDKTNNIYIVPKSTKELNIYSFSINHHVTWSNKHKPRYLFIPSSVTKINDYGVAEDQSYEYLFSNEDNIIIFGEKGSVAENFANGDNELNIKFKFRTWESSNKEQIILTENQITIYPGNTYKLYAISIPSYIIIPVTWKSIDESIISVDKSGTIVSKNLGTADVIASVENYKSVICNIIVTYPK